jgi:hypothetical protein
MHQYTNVRFSQYRTLKRNKSASFERLVSARSGHSIDPQNNLSDALKTANSRIMVAVLELYLPKTFGRS